MKDKKTRKLICNITGKSLFASKDYYDKKVVKAGSEEILHHTYMCQDAKMLLKKYKVKYTEYDVEDTKKRNLMKKRTNGKFTVPQIFINNDHLGGFDELNSLHLTGTLKNLWS